LVQIIFQVAWVSGATIGALVGSALPIERVQGLDFALTALFVVLSIDAYRARPDRLSAMCALGCAVVAALLVPEQMLVWAFAGYTALLLVRLVAAQRRRSGD
jgi:4-azaleucine resistance transporter AzlC